MSLIIDSFAGGGGASLGIERALGRPVDIAINHDESAIEMHAANHPTSLHLREDVWKVDPVKTCAGRPVRLMWLSPNCTHFSRAKGGVPVDRGIRALAWVAVWWARKVRPAVIALENVPEFESYGPLNADNRPCAQRKGLSFRKYVGNLRGLGYRVEWRVLNAADFGAHQHRRRLFLVARCDGEPIAWPAPTHGPGRAHAWRPAHEIIDWTLPCPSIFGRRKPLADATLRRIANGLRRYVFESAEPFIVRTGHYSHRTGEGFQFRGQGLNAPLGAVCATNEKALITPYAVPLTHQGTDRAHDMRAPMPTITAAHRGEIALVAPHLSQFFGGMVGKDIRDPLPTVTAIDHNALAAAFLTKWYGTSTGSSLFTGVPTVTGGGQHLGDVRAFLTKWYGACEHGQTLFDSLHTITSKPRFGLVMVQGQPYQLVDVGLRMLSPRELARAQGFPDEYVLTGTKTSQIARIGNAVVPLMAELIVRANVVKQPRAEVAS